MRLFVAVNFPADLCERLWSAALPLREMDLPVRWIGAAGMHLTLKFLGEVDDGRLPELTDALERAVVQVRPLPVTIQGFGAFPTPARPTLVWAGIVPEPALELLQHGVERAFSPLGFPPDGRPFRPHVTLGRVRRDAPRGAFRGLDRALKSLGWSETVVVDRIALMRSTTGQRGAVYEELRNGRLS